MLAKIFSGATLGLSAVLIEVEVDVASQGLPSTTIVGLPSKAVDEAKERVRAAMKNSSAEYPSRRNTINLAPADLPKEGPAFDLPIAVGLLTASEQIEVDLSDALILGELSLDGSVRRSKGALPITMMAKQKGLKRVFLPASNAREASIVEGVAVYGINSLEQLVSHLIGQVVIEPLPTAKFESLVSVSQAEFDFTDIHGQESAKRALEIAAAGGHNLFMHGTPGAGKTMMARAFAGILPVLTKHEAIEVTKIYSITGNIDSNQTVITSRPFRSPHHTTSKIGLIGGGSRPQPGEVSLAHRGVLFLDELPEFPKDIIESLRQPIEDGLVHISRAAGTMTFPARFILIAAANPCPCGYFGSERRECKCHPAMIERYQKKISGPILDRIDLHVHVSEVPLETLVKPAQSETSEVIRQRVQLARNLQQKRYHKSTISSNAELSTQKIKKFCPLSQEVNKFLLQAASSLNLSARSYNKVIKVARTISDLAHSQDIDINHISEALQYRPKVIE